MDQQIYAAHVVLTSNVPLTPPVHTPVIQEHTQFLPKDRATQILLQQFV